MDTNLLSAEWTKIRAVRSTAVNLAVTALLCLGVAYAGTAGLHGGQMTATARRAFDPVAQAMYGFILAQLFIAPLGALAITSEYSTGLIRATFAVTPQRRAVLAAKATVLSALALVVGELLGFGSFFLGQLVLHGQHLDISIGQPGVLRAVSWAGLYLAAVALVALGLGTVIRSTAGTVAAMLALVFLLPHLMQVLPAPWADRLGRYMFANCGQQLMSLRPITGPYLSVWASALVVAGYVVVALGTAAFIITRRDA